MIYCIGDSFTFGDELSDVKRQQPNPSELAWPSLLSAKLNHPVTNLGRRAAGNTRVIKRTIDCVLTTNDPVIISWTSPLRIEVADSDGIFDAWPGRNTAIMSPSRASFVKELTNLTNDHTEFWAYKQWLRDVLLLQSFLKQHNRSYLMIQSHVTQWMNNQFEHEVIELKNQIDQSKFLGWYEGMTEWTYGLKKGPNGHFLEDGHQIVADKVYEHIRHLGWIS